MAAIFGQFPAIFRFSGALMCIFEISFGRSPCQSTELNKWWNRNINYFSILKVNLKTLTNIKFLNLSFKFDILWIPSSARSPGFLLYWFITCCVLSSSHQAWWCRDSIPWGPLVAILRVGKDSSSSQLSSTSVYGCSHNFWLVPLRFLI